MIEWLLLLNIHNSINHNSMINSQHYLKELLLYMVEYLSQKISNLYKLLKVKQTYIVVKQYFDTLQTNSK
jgi:hypothetical protein